MVSDIPRSDRVAEKPFLVEENGKWFVYATWLVLVFWLGCNCRQPSIVSFLGCGSCSPNYIGIGKGNHWEINLVQLRAGKEYWKRSGIGRIPVAGCGLQRAMLIMFLGSQDNWGIAKQRVFWGKMLHSRKVLHLWRILLKVFLWNLACCTNLAQSAESWVRFISEKNHQNHKSSMKQFPYIGRAAFIAIPFLILTWS